MLGHHIEGHLRMVRGVTRATWPKARGLRIYIPLRICWGFMQDSKAYEKCLKKISVTNTKLLCFEDVEVPCSRYTADKLEATSAKVFVTAAASEKTHISRALTSHALAP